MHSFPVIATFPDGLKFSMCYLVGNPDHAGGSDVWCWSPQRGRAEIVAHGPDLPTRESAPNTWRLDTADGPVILAKDESDCGCSHPMKRFRPPQPVRDWTLEPSGITRP